MLESAKKAVSIPVIGSLNGSSPGGWARYAKLIQEAGADAIELNIYFVATDPEMSSADVEWRYLDLVATVHDAVQIPIAVKIGSQFSNLTNLFRAWRRLGQTALCCSIDSWSPISIWKHCGSRRAWCSVIGTSCVRRCDGLRSCEIRFRSRWLRPVAFIIPEDVIKLLLVGADVCMITSTLLRHGVEYVGEMLPAIQNWLDEHDYESVEQLKGSMSYGNCPDAGNLERANYMKAIVSYTAANAI